MSNNNNNNNNKHMGQRERNQKQKKKFFFLRTHSRAWGRADRCNSFFFYFFIRLSCGIYYSTAHTKQNKKKQNVGHYLSLYPLYKVHTFRSIII